MIKVGVAPSISSSPNKKYSRNSKNTRPMLKSILENHSKYLGVIMEVNIVQLYSKNTARKLESRYRQQLPIHLKKIVLQKD